MYVEVGACAILAFVLMQHTLLWTRHNTSGGGGGGGGSCGNELAVQLCRLKILQGDTDSGHWNMDSIRLNFKLLAR